MERWVPLFDIFLNSPCPEVEASVWFQQNHHRELRHPTSAFLSLLLTPTEVVCRRSPSSAPTIRRRMWLQTLPHATQSRVLSFLTIESRRFCGRLLCSIATQIIDFAKEEEADAGAPLREGRFWVVRAARNLLDAIPAHVRRELVVHGGDEEGGEGDLGEDEDGGADFGSLPRWLEDAAAISRPLLPWLPLSASELRRGTHMALFIPRKEESDDVVPMDEERRAPSEVEVDRQILSPQIVERAEALKAKLCSLDSSSDTNAIHLSQAIHNLCADAGGGSVVPNVLSLIEPWETDEEIMLVLTSDLLGRSELEYREWPIHVFSAAILPRLLRLQCTSSRMLSSITIDFCKSHQKDVATVLLFPLIHRKEGINAPICDVLAKVMKECMHPSQISAFCQRLLCMKCSEMELVCLPRHRDILSDELEWTESLFWLFQQILSWNVRLTPDTVDNLIFVLEDVDGRFSKSLKLGRFLLSLVTKSDHALRCHKLSLRRIAEKTDTILTKSLVSKLT